MMMNKWWLPIRLGIPLAVLTGLACCWPIRADLLFYNYYHLYFTAGKLVVGSIDRATAFIVPTLLLFLFIGLLFRRFRWPARIAMIVAVVALYAAIAHLGRYDAPALQALDNLSSTMPTSSLIVGLLGGCGLLFLLVLALRAIWRVRALQRSVRGVGMASGMLLSLVFLFVNLATGMLYLRNVIGLHRQPNVIYIMVDTLRADHMGCYGYRRNTSPNIDSFAGESTLFSRTISQAPFTPWSVYSFMSSHYPDIPSVTQKSVPHYFQYPLLTDYLRERGYTTHAVISNDMVKMVTRFPESFDRYDDAMAADMEGSSSPGVTAAALRELDTMRTGKHFLFLLYFDPHLPYIKHPGFTFDQETGKPRPRQLSQAVNHTAVCPEFTRRATDLTNGYDGEIAFTDQYVGKLIDALKARGLYDHSLIVFLSDHGEELMEHGHSGHMNTLYEEVLSVPLIIKFPQQRQGTVVGGTFQLLDLAPSVLGILDAGNPAYLLSGRDMQVHNLQTVPNRAINSSTINDARSVRDNDYSFIHPSLREPEELYRLRDDPWEQHNMRTRLPRLTQQWRRTLAARYLQSPLRGLLRPYPAMEQNPANAVPLDKLRSLGYAQ